MGDVVFVRPTHNYDSYSDLWRLVELSGYPLIRWNEMDLESDNCYIFSTPSTFWHDGLERSGFPDARARMIYLNIEWYMDVDYRSIPGVEVWSADKFHADKNGVRYVPLGSHAGLNPTPELRTDTRYDLVTLWADSNRRYHAYDLLQRVNMRLAPKGWDKDRHQFFTQSRAMCIVHQNDTAHCVAPQRMALAAAYKLPVISEYVEDSGIFKDAVIWTDLESVGEVSASWLMSVNASRLAEKGEQLHQMLCVDMPFRASIERAL